MSDKKVTGLLIEWCSINVVGGVRSDFVWLPRILSVSSLPPGIWLWQRTRLSSPRNLAFHTNYIPSLVNGHPKWSLNILAPIHRTWILSENPRSCLSRLKQQCITKLSFLYHQSHTVFWVIPFIFAGTLWRIRLRHCNISRKIAGSIPDGVI
jgi:hypothetical protein